jgi:hypothetical protein
MDFSTLPELSGAIQQLAESFDTLSDQLSALYLTPHEIYKKMLFEEGYKFPTLDDIEVPGLVTTEGLINAIDDLQKNHQKVVLDTLANPDKYNITDNDKEVSILAELSGDNTFVVTEQKFKNHVEYNELIQSIDINSVTSENCYDIIRKLGYFYVKTITQKTV